MTGVVWPRLADGLPPLQAPYLMRSSESAILGTLPMGLVVEVSPVGSKSVGEPTDRSYAVSYTHLTLPTKRIV